jgi:DNA repair exonuclease SbcCD ATPase subunit
MILFKKIRYKNFLSTGNLFTEIELNKNNTTLIVGDNGAGKSTVLDALSYGLFGKAFRKVNKPQLVNSITQKNLVVEIEFSISNNEYKIIRGMKPNIFEVYQNGNLLNQSAEMKDYQEILEKQIIKVNHKSFCQVVVLGSATFQPFMQLAAGQRREIIEDLLDLQIFSTMNVLLKDKIFLNEENINKYNSEKKIIDEKLKLVKQHLLEVQNNNEQLIEEKKHRIEETNIKINSLNEEFWKYENLRKELEEQIEGKETLTSKLNKLTKLKHQIDVKLSLIKKDIVFFDKHDNCPTCRQPIDEKFKCETLDSRKAESQKLEEGLELLTKQYDEANGELSSMLEIRTKISNIEIEINSVKTKTSSLIVYRSSLEEEINAIAKKIANNDQNKITDLENELKLIKVKYDELIDNRQIYSAAASLLKDGGIKAKIIKQYIPIINKLINKYLSSMEFLCQFELDEEFNETIKSRFRDEFSYSSFSEGEKFRINLAILFAWRAIAKMRNSINTNILIMDEVMDSSLDYNGTEEFLKIINNLTNDTNTFIISHKTDQLYDKFERVIRFEKHKNFSRMI